MSSYGKQLEHELSTAIAVLLLQIVFILIMCRLIGRILSVLKQPPVVGEILAGIIIGPTVIGQSTTFSNFMFPASGAVLLKGISDLGIVFFMFILGLEFSPGEVLEAVKKTWLISIAAIAVPFGLGCAISPYLSVATGSEDVDFASFLLFTAACLSFTAFPVLARILTANNAMTTNIGLVAMGIGCVNDVVAWTVLAIATGLHGGGNPQNGAWGILLGIAWVLFLTVVVRRILDYLKERLGHSNFIVFIFLGMCVSAWFTQILGLHAFFGGFCFGVSVPKSDKAFVIKFIEQLEVVVVNFFVPLFFANTGLRTDFRALSGSPGTVLAVLACAALGKLVPTFFLGKCVGYTWKFSFQLASLMNSRGLMELIALEVAQAVGVFNVQMKSCFVVMALVTTFMAGPMFYFSYDPKVDPPQDQKESPTPKEDLPQDKTEDGADIENPASPLPRPRSDRTINPALHHTMSSLSRSYLFSGTLYEKPRHNHRTSLADVFSFQRPDMERENSKPHSHTGDRTRKTQEVELHESKPLAAADSSGRFAPMRAPTTPSFEMLRSQSAHGENLPHATSMTPVGHSSSAPETSSCSPSAGSSRSSSPGPRGGADSYHNTVSAPAETEKRGSLGGVHAPPEEHHSEDSSQSSRTKTATNTTTSDTTANTTTNTTTSTAPIVDNTASTATTTNTTTSTTSAPATTTLHVDPEPSPPAVVHLNTAHVAPAAAQTETTQTTQTNTTTQTTDAPKS